MITETVAARIEQRDFWIDAIDPGIRLHLR